MDVRPAPASPVSPQSLSASSFFFFNDTATTEIYTLSLHDALPISRRAGGRHHATGVARARLRELARSEEHTSELQSRSDLVCRLLLEKNTARFLPGFDVAACTRLTRSLGRHPAR